MINILIVEDSITDAQFYKNSIIPIENVNLLFVKSGEEALEIIERNDVNIDVFFLDVHLPGIDGFGLAKKIREIGKYTLTFIVFITGYSKNQLDVFKELHCYDYIVKPFSIEEFSLKVNTLINTVLTQKKEPEKSRIIFIPTSDGDYLINPYEIFYAETYRNDCYIHTEKEVIHLLGVSLKNLLETVNNEYFLRCHKSYAVNVKKIFKIKEVNYRLWQISFRDYDKIIYVGQKFYEDIMTKYKQLVE